MRRRTASRIAAMLALAAVVGTGTPGWAARRGATGPEAAAKLKAAGDEYKAAGNVAAAIEQYQKAIAADPSHVPSLQEYGRTLYAREEFEEAADQFKKLLEVNPDDAVGWYNLGYALRKQQDYEGATEAFQKYVAANPSDPDGYYALGECFRARGLHTEAAAQYDLYVEKETRPSEQAWVEKARTKSATMKTEASNAAVATAQPTPQPAAASLVAAAQPAPQPTPVAQPQPVAQPTPVAQPQPVAQPTPVAQPQPVAQPTPVAQPQPVAQPTPVAQPQPVAQPEPAVATQPAPAATVAAAPMRTRDPTGAVYKIREGDRMFQQKRFREALDSYQDAVRLDDQSTNAILKMGLAMANLGQYAEAIEKWERVLQLDPGNKYATTYIQRAKPRVAASTGSTSPKPLDTGSPLANAQANAGTAQPARPQATAQDVAVARDAYRQAVGLINSSRFAESLGPLQTAIERHPTFVNAYVARGGAYLGLRRYEDAAADYRKSLELNPNLATPLYGLGRVYEKLGDTPKAIEYYRRYAKSDGPDAQATLKRRADRAADDLSRR